MCIIICAGIETVFVHDSTIQAHFDALIAQGNLVVLVFIQNHFAFIQDHFCDVGLLGSYIAIGIDVGGVFLENVVSAQADATVHSFHQFRISTDAGCFFRYVSICAGFGFIGIRCIQSTESICHVLINGIDTLYQIVIDLLDHLVLGLVSAKAGCRFLCQGGVQVGHIFADGVGCFHDGPILYDGIILAHILVRSLFFQIFLHIGDPGIQRRIRSFTSGRFRIQVTLQFIRRFVNLIGFVRDAFIQFVVFRFPGCSFIGICLVQGSESISHVLVDGVDACYQVIINLLNHLVLRCISAKASSRFLGHSGVQVGYILTDGLICFNDGSVLYRCISLAHIIIPGFLQYILLNGSNPVIQGLIAGFTGGCFVCHGAGISFLTDFCLSRICTYNHIAIAILRSFGGRFRTICSCCFSNLSICIYFGR